MTIVMGPPCAGKSTYIKEHFPNIKVIDLFDFQDYEFATVENVMKSYESCALALQEVIKKNEDVILEHTLLKAIRRKYYIDKIRKISNCDINIVCLVPSLEKLIEHAKERKCCTDAEYHKLTLETLEIPKISEGYKEVTIIAL